MLVFFHVHVSPSIVHTSGVFVRAATKNHDYAWKVYAPYQRGPNTRPRGTEFKACKLFKDLFNVVCMLQ